MRRLLERFNNGESSCSEVCESLGIRRTRLYELRHEWLKDRDGFTPGVSGGDRNGKWPADCEALALDLIAIGPVNFALIADEMDRRFGFSRSRAAVRDYLVEHFPLLVQGARPGPKPFRRWQCGKAGEIWQHDSTPVLAWPSERKQALISTVDDHTRKVVLTSIFERETLWAHFVHFRRAFTLYGIPEMLYTDGFTMFGREGNRDLATKCGRMLLALSIAHRIAPTPQAKGKIERNVGTMQMRLVPLLIQAGVRREEDCPAVVDPHNEYWNAVHENRTTGLPPDASLALAAREGRVAYRPCPRLKSSTFTWPSTRPAASPRQIRSATSAGCGGSARPSRKPSGSSSTLTSGSGSWKAVPTPSTRLGRQSWPAIRFSRRQQRYGHTTRRSLKLSAFALYN